MSTTALNGMRSLEPNYCSIMPQKPSVRQVVREEIKRQKELDKLEEKYQAGEISKFEYYINKVALNLPQHPTDFPCTVEYMA